MYINQAKANMAAGQPAVGISCGLQSPVSTEICARLGYDWVMLEQQHWVWDWSLFQHALISIVAGGSVPFARVSRNNVTEIGQALDAGMLGIVVPMVHTADDARRAGEAVRYPPRGVRSLGRHPRPALRARLHGLGRRPDPHDGPDRIRPGRRQQRSHPRRTHR